MGTCTKTYESCLGICDHGTAGQTFSDLLGCMNDQCVSTCTAHMSPPCSDLLAGGDDCDACIVANCCAETEECYSDYEQLCWSDLDCLKSCAGPDLLTCTQTCDDFNYDLAFVSLAYCMNDYCPDSCGK